jgi:hypothetical protein
MDMDDEKAGIKNQQTGCGKKTLFEGLLINAKGKKVIKFVSFARVELILVLILQKSRKSN